MYKKPKAEPIGATASAEQNRYKFEDFNSREFDMRLMLIGRTGSGKSSVGNSILGKTEFPVGKGGFRSTTTECQVDMVLRRNKRIRVLDTCGMFDTKRPREEVDEEIRKSHLMIAPGPHAFLLIVPIEQYTAEHQESVRRLEDIFPNFYGHAVVVFTKADTLDGPLEEALAECDALKALCDRVSGRYTAFNNKEKNEARLDQQVYGLLDMVYDLYEANKQRHYKSDLFEQAERLASQHAERIVVEAEHANRRDTQKVDTAITLLRRLPRNTLRHTVDGAHADSIARMILNNEMKSGRARGVFSAMSFDVLAAAINPTTDLSTGSVYVKTKTGERVKDSAALQELK